MGHLLGVVIIQNVSLQRDSKIYVDVIKTLRFIDNIYLCTIASKSKKDILNL